MVAWSPALATGNCWARPRGEEVPAESLPRLTQDQEGRGALGSPLPVGPGPGFRGAGEGQGGPGLVSAGDAMLLVKGAHLESYSFKNILSEM